MNREFVLGQGISVNGAEKMKACYGEDSEGINGLLGADMICDVARGFIEMIDEPIFFFLELPATEGEEYDVYYLDNCTRDVALAIVKRYGELLSNDGLSRFGFGSNKTEEEIYFRDYQEFMVYSKKNAKVKAMLEKNGAEKMDKPVSMWDLFTTENPGCCSAVELNGETAFDIVENLKSVGMYKA